MEREIRVLVTGAGAPGIRGTLYALRKNPDGVRVHCIGCDMNDDAVGRFLVDRFYRVPPPEQPAYVTELMSISQREKVDLVIPQTTREVAVLARDRRRLEEQGVKVMVATQQAVEFANNKLRVYQAFERLGLPYPKYYRVTCAAELREYAGELGYPGVPVVVKPAVSNGMRGLRILRQSPWDTQRFLTEKPDGVEIPLEGLIEILGEEGSWPELLLTEYLPGSEFSVDVFLGASGGIAIPRLRETIRSGISFVTSVCDRRDLVDYALTAARYLGLSYVFGFQFKLDRTGVPKVLECNPRIQGTMVASVFAGANVIWLAVREALGDPAPKVPDRIKTARFYRFWGGLGVTDEGVYEI